MRRCKVFGHIVLTRKRTLRGPFPFLLGLPFDICLQITFAMSEHAVVKRSAMLFPDQMFKGREVARRAAILLTGH